MKVCTGGVRTELALWKSPDRIVAPDRSTLRNVTSRAVVPERSLPRQLTCVWVWVAWGGGPLCDEKRRHANE